MKLIFTGPADVHNIFGKLKFSANGLRYAGQAAGRPGTVACALPRDDGGCDVYGVQGASGKVMSIIRSRTYDGVHYAGAEVVWQKEMDRWLWPGAIAYDPEHGRFLALIYSSSKRDKLLWAIGSEDGAQWKMLKDEPVYIDHDAFSLLWDSRASRWIAYQTTYQAWPKRYPDNAGANVRRVMHLRTSRDGVTWDPPDKASLNGPHALPERLITPDADDPEEMEFYMFTAFPYAGRYAGMMLNYAPSPAAVNPYAYRTAHGPQLSCEWWLSADGERWQRPYRDVFAAGEADWTIHHAPMNFDGRHLWDNWGKIYSLPEDHLFWVGSLANAEFSTAPFEFKDRVIKLRAANCFHEDAPRGMRSQSYIMAEAQDAEGRTIPGYEKERCILAHVPVEGVYLRWVDAFARRLEGRMIRLKFYFRDARIYSVTTEAG